ncbi:hypothetical protein FRC03_008007 [Tulasnella sp. 419]|nr:hypothetical protein FRC03_008007 [Tulasnella sp. 419]
MIPSFLLFLSLFGAFSSAIPLNAIYPSLNSEINGDSVGATINKRGKTPVPVCPEVKELFDGRKGFLKLNKFARVIKGVKATEVTETCLYEVEENVLFDRRDGVPGPGKVAVEAIALLQNDEDHSKQLQEALIREGRWHRLVEDVNQKWIITSKRQWRSYAQVLELAGFNEVQEESGEYLVLESWSRQLTV